MEWLRPYVGSAVLLSSKTHRVGDELRRPGCQLLPDILAPDFQVSFFSSPFSSSWTQPASLDEGRAVLFQLHTQPLPTLHTGLQRRRRHCPQIKQLRSSEEPE